MSDASDDQMAREGASFSPSTPEEREAAVAAAIDYRGDVCIHTRDGRSLEGYVFDHRPHANPPVLRMMLKADDARLSLPFEQIDRIELSGRDAAAGRSWETWVRKYAEKKARGESPSMDPTPLHED